MNQFCRYPKNAKFWVWNKEGFVKLTLTPGEVIQRREFQSTDEGWSSLTEEWRHNGDRIVHEGAYAGRDCDGRHSYDFETFALLTKLQVILTYTYEGLERPDVLIPDWQDAKSTVYDQYAQLSNY
jgi:hypothetical protein